MKRLKKIRFEDIKAIFLFLFACVVKYLPRYRNKKVWLVCESGFEARDNGYWLFKYIRENHSDIDVAFVITRDSPDFEKISHLGEYVEYKSLKHWIYYLNAQANISSHKAGNPNAAVCYVLEVIFNMSKNRVFLQHGITLSDAKWLYYEKTKFKLFICGAKPEYDYILENFGYPENIVQYVGFCRFDSLENKPLGSTILIMPSWRNWLVNHSDNQAISKKEIEVFQKSSYYLNWRKFLNNSELHEYCKYKKIGISFFPHRNMQPYLELFSDIPYIELISWKDRDIQDMLKESKLLITDYSSVSLDFSYMDKPTVYYQFDNNEFREKQYAQGYFDYENGGFGPLIKKSNDILSIVKELAETDFKNPIEYTKRIDDFFLLRDNRNCFRTVEIIREMVDGGME